MVSWFGERSVEVYNDIRVNTLPLNYAYVLLNTSLDNIGVYSVNEDCFKCPYKRQNDEFEYDIFRRGKTKAYQVYTGEESRWRILNNDQGEFIQPDYVRGLMCEMKPILEEYGVYRLDVGKCVMETEVPPVNVYLPLLLFSVIILSAVTAFELVKLFLRRNKERHNDGLNLTARRDNSDIMTSLHFLRGLLLILIIFVTTGGGGYPIFNKNYGGLTVANCLLFVYTFSIGLKIPMADEDSRTLSKWARIGLIILRSLFLLFIGTAVSAGAPRSRFLSAPLWAPLQCIAISYLVAAIIYMICNREDKSMKSTGIVGTLFWSWCLGAFLIIIMVVSIHIFYYTECKQYTEFDPRRNAWMARGNNCQEGDAFSEVFNKNLLRVNWDIPFYVDSYYVFTEGILGVLSYIITALLGLKAGVIYFQNEDHNSRIKQWCICAFVFGAIGIGLAAVSRPLNFNLWPISTILLISSINLIVYIFIYYLTEIRELSSGIVTTCGIASIGTLAGHLLFSYNFPFCWGEYLDTHFLYLWQSAWIVILWILVTISWMNLRCFLIGKLGDNGAPRVVFAW